MKTDGKGGGFHLAAMNQRETLHWEKVRAAEVDVSNLQLDWKPKTDPDPGPDR